MIARACLFSSIPSRRGHCKKMSSLSCFRSSTARSEHMRRRREGTLGSAYAIQASLLSNYSIVSLPELSSFCNKMLVVEYKRFATVPIQQANKIGHQSFIFRRIGFIYRDTHALQDHKQYPSQCPLLPRPHPRHPRYQSLFPSWTDHAPHNNHSRHYRSLLPE